MLRLMNRRVLLLPTEGNQPYHVPTMEPTGEMPAIALSVTMYRAEFLPLWGGTAFWRRYSGLDWTSTRWIRRAYY